MKKFVFFAVLSLGLLASFSADARVQNYIDSNHHLWVWYNGAYNDMGVYYP
jgi:hypothetical protein